MWRHRLGVLTGAAPCGAQVVAPEAASAAGAALAAGAAAAAHDAAPIIDAVRLDGAERVSRGCM